MISPVSLPRTQPFDPGTPRPAPAQQLSKDMTDPRLTAGVAGKSRQDTIIEGSLEVKLPTIWTNGKEEVGRVREQKRRADERRSEKRKSQKKKDAGAR